MSDGKRGDVELAVVGGGPAGLAAATAAADAHVRVVLIDAAGQPGGQFWRHADETVRADDGAVHHDWQTYQRLAASLRAHIAAGRITYVASHQVWTIERSGTEHRRFTLHLTPTIAAVDNPIRSVDATSLVLCPGGYDRQLPIPGWTLPGVMSAGGVQALLKASNTVAGARAVIAGTGPFLLPVAAGLAAAGADVVGVCEANSPARWLPQLPATLRTPGKAREALEYASELARHRVGYLPRTTVTRIHGTESVTGATIDRLDRDGAVIPGKERRVDVDLVALGWGFTPSAELAITAGVRTYRDVDGSLVAETDKSQRSSVAGVYVAGEITGVGGAPMAVAEGELAGRVAAAEFDRGIDGPRVDRLRRTIANARAFARAMHRAHPVPRHWNEWPDERTVLCRCEEITVGSVRAAHDDLGATDPRTVKSLSRPGMGWCQGRMCGFATAELLAADDDRPTTADDLRPIATRPCAVPVPLGDLGRASKSTD